MIFPIWIARSRNSHKNVINTRITINILFLVLEKLNSYKTGGQKREDLNESYCSKVQLLISQNPEYVYPRILVNGRIGRGIVDTKAKAFCYTSQPNTQSIWKFTQNPVPSLFTKRSFPNWVFSLFAGENL